MLYASRGRWFDEQGFGACAELEALRANVWLLSPPCQPFTRNGNRYEHRAKDKGLLKFISRDSQIYPSKLNEFGPKVQILQG